MAATVYVQVGGGGPAYTPFSVAIQPGDTVQWDWAFTPLHGSSVTSGEDNTPDGLFDSGIRGTGATFSYTFASPGTFFYFSRVESIMIGVVEVAGSTAPSTLGNISTRLLVQSGDNVLIGGLIATGTVPKRVIIRAIGPSLTPFGVTGALANPTLDLFQGSTLLFSNDDWNESTQQAEIAATGLSPSNAAEAAIVWTLTPGQNYTAVVRGKNGTTGIGVVDAFDLDQAAASKLGNISTRGFVGVDDNVMIAGLIAGPSSGTSLKVLARALGPTLSDFGITGALANPTLDLVNSSGTVIRSNDNWKNDSQQRALIETAGLAPSHDEEAALVETVAPGSYTVVVRGSGRTTGIGLVEAYNIP
jgi:plastocyanin